MPLLPLLLSLPAWLWKHRVKVLLALTALFYLWIGKLQSRVRGLESALMVKPAVSTVAKTEKAVERRLGPTRTTRRTVVAPDGTKTVETTREVEAEEIHSAAHSEEEHTETPVFAPISPARTRYVGLGIDPSELKRPRLRAGVTLFQVFDAGVAYDTRFKLLGGAIQLEGAYRF